jgi:hypothetical protein
MERVEQVHSRRAVHPAQGATMAQEASQVKAALRVKTRSAPAGTTDLHHA